MFQKILSAAVLTAGMLYALYILIDSYRDREAVKAMPGDLRRLIPLEVIVFFISSLGVSDILQNTLVVNHYRLCSDENMPGTLIGSGIVPGSIIAFKLLRAGTPLDVRLIIICCITLIMRAALIVSFAFLVIKIIVSAGAAGTGTGLGGIKLAVAAAVCFFTGMFNMFGIPMKPTWTALFLIMGLSPIIVLTLTLVFGSITPISGGVSILRNGKYQKKMFLAGVTGGSAGAVLGTAFAVTLPAAVLNVLLIGVMLIAIISMFRKK